MCERQNSRPLIGIAPSHNGDCPTTTVRYMNAVWNSGGNPVILAYTTDPKKLAEYAEVFDGFLFSGGVDVNPVLYGEEKQFDSVEIDDERDAFEKGLFDAVMPTGKPILGICRGIQSLNVFRGGTLHQHMEGHRQEAPGTTRTYAVTVTEGSLLHRLCGKSEILVNTFHHQAVKDVAPGLVVDGISADGYVEALHDPQHPFFLAVQFHPEFYCGLEDDDHSRPMFEAFIDACR